MKNSTNEDTMSEKLQVVRTSSQFPISDAQLTELQRMIRNRGAGREIHSYILAALRGDMNARYFCAGVWEARHAEVAR